MTLKRNILFCIDTLAGGGAEKLLIDVLKKMDHGLFVIDLCVLSGYGIYFNDIPEQVNLVGYENCKWKEYDVEVAFLEGSATRVIALCRSAAVKIAWVHSDLFTYHWTSGFYKNTNEEALCYSMMDQIVFVSNTAMQQFDKLFPKIQVRKKVIYNLLDKEEIILKSQANTCPVKKTKLTLCSIGSLFPVKGFDHLIPVLSNLKKEGLDFHYWIFGEGHQRNVIQNLIEQHDLKDIVFLMGFQKDIYPCLRESDIFVSVSLTEGFSLVVGEALCLGKPIVSTNVSGTAELLGYGKYGMLVNTDNDSIYNGLKKIISNKLLRTIYAGKAKAGSATDIFDIQKNINRINNLLHYTVSEKTPLNHIAHRLFIDNETNADPGLLYGKMGKVIFFLRYSAFTGNKIYEEYAMELINEISCLIHIDTSVSYENGLAGIGVGIEYLAQHQLIEGNTNDILQDFDKRLYEITFNSPVSNFSLLNGYMGIARYWMYRLHNPANVANGKKTRIVKSLDHILSVILAQIVEIESNDEKSEIYRFLCDIKQFPQFNRRADVYMNKYFDIKYFQEYASQSFSHLKFNPVNEYIRNCLNQKYFGIPVKFSPSQNKINLDTEPHLLNGIISDGLFLLTLNQEDNQWIYLL